MGNYDPSIHRCFNGGWRHRFNYGADGRCQDCGLAQGGSPAEKVEQLRAHVDLAKAQATNGDYEHGMANGLIWALHTMEGREGTPRYVDGKD